MGSKLQKNAIMMGYINSYCLVCECYFDNDEEISDHIQDKSHVDNLLTYSYLEKYGDNRIRKVNKGYFCEFCSLLLATAAKVSLHVQEKAHYEKKGTFLLHRPSGIAAVLAFDDLLINERAWHSLTEDTCAICNEEFDNENIHKTESGHLLRLVQNKVEFGTGNSIYRKTDDISFQCLTCNAVFALNTLNDHFNDAEHKILYTKCQEEYKKYLEQNKNKESEKLKEITKSDATDKKDDGKDKTEKNLVDKNHNDVKPNSEAKETHSCNCKELVSKTTKPEPEDESTKFAKGNNLTYNTGNTTAFCRICETKLPATLRSMKEHVNGKEHKNRLGRLNQQTQAAKASPRITKKPMGKFIESCVTIENIFYEVVVVNEKYCLPIPSMAMMTKVGTRYRCQACEVTVSEDDIEEHTESPRHDRAMQVTPVITSLPDSEFVREVRPGIFHCGYCNLIVPRWDDVASHLQSREHTDNKDASAWRLQRHMPSIVEHRRRQEMCSLDMYRMLAMMGGHRDWFR